MNARFWDFCNGGWVKITLKPHQTLSWENYSNTDEGFSFIRQNWIHNDDMVSYVEYSSGRDCDGPTEYTLIQRARMCDLKSVPVYDYRKGRGKCLFHKPIWSTIKESQRDHFAEAMGY